MTERCPLSGARGGIDVPKTCMEQCEALWDQAILEASTDGDYDIYHPPEYFEEGECNHDGTLLEHSHDALQSVDGSSLRLYTLVDQCMVCSQEFGEQAYAFDCPYNDSG